MRSWDEAVLHAAAVAAAAASAGAAPSLQLTLEVLLVRRVLTCGASRHNAFRLLTKQLRI